LAAGGPGGPGALLGHAHDLRDRRLPCRDRDEQEEQAPGRDLAAEGAFALGVGESPDVRDAGGVEGGGIGDRGQLVTRLGMEILIPGRQGQRLITARVRTPSPPEVREETGLTVKAGRLLVPVVEDGILAGSSSKATSSVTMVTRRSTSRLLKAA
jgi:hypothetical protein